MYEVEQEHANVFLDGTVVNHGKMAVVHMKDNVCLKLLQYKLTYSFICITQKG